MRGVVQVHGGSERTAELSTQCQDEQAFHPMKKAIERVAPMAFGFSVDPQQLGAAPEVYSSIGGTSPSWALTQAAMIEIGVDAAMKRTLPSHIAAWLPLPWKE